MALFLAAILFVLSFLAGMMGLGVAFIATPVLGLFGLDLKDTIMPLALWLNGLTNTVSLLFATINYWRGGLINWHVGIPVLMMAVILSPLGAWLTPLVDKTVLLTLFAAFLAFAGAIMLFYQAKPRKSQSAEMWKSVQVGW